jgi:hypothetical protein
MTIVVSGFNHTQIIYFSIAIKIQIGECRIWVIEHLLKLLKILCLSKESSHSLEVKIL